MAYLTEWMMEQNSENKIQHGQFHPLLTTVEPVMLVMSMINNAATD